MRSRIYWARVRHCRNAPVCNEFEYPLYVYAVDLAELPLLDRASRLFGYNRLRPVSLYDADYLTTGPEPIRAKLDALLAANNVDPDPVDAVWLVTSARYLGYVFVPVSFYLMYDAKGAPYAAAAEVNNTFGDKHVYLLDTPGGQGFPVRFQAEKAFHVSPFFDLCGGYRFVMDDVRERLDISVELHRGAGKAFTARLWSEAEGLPLDHAGLTRTLRRFPLQAALTFPRIARQAARLRFRYKLPVHPRPEPFDPMTIRHRPPSMTARLGQRLARAIQPLAERGVLSYLRRLKAGRLHLTMPDGRELTFGGQLPGIEASMRITDPAVLARVALGRDIGFGEAYTDGQWSSPDVAAVLGIFIDNRPHLSLPRLFNMAGGSALAMLRLRRMSGRRNTRDGSRQNIRAHYDLGNQLFTRFLDPTLTYSSGVFRNLGGPLDAPEEADDGLEAAQRRKLGMIAAKARLSADDHVLEIGCGWGSFAIEAAKRCGCRVTALTISNEQHALATRRVREAGLQDRVEVRLEDYRDVRGTFSRIVSIEMLEAVGHRYLPDYFRAVDRLMAPGGLAVLQVITIFDQRYPAYRREGDWVRKHIFPGGHLPSLTELTRVMTRHTGLIVQDVENIGPHYARTLALWKHRFADAAPELAEIGYDERFQRAWNFYLDYCRAGFEAGVINDLQLVLSRPERASTRLMAQHVEPDSP